VKQLHFDIFRHTNGMVEGLSDVHDEAPLPEQNRFNNLRHEHRGFTEPSPGAEYRPQRPFIIDETPGVLVLAGHDVIEHISENDTGEVRRVKSAAPHDLLVMGIVGRV